MRTRPTNVAPGTTAVNLKPHIPLIALVCAVGLAMSPPTGTHASSASGPGLQAAAKKKKKRGKRVNCTNYRTYKVSKKRTFTKQAYKCVRQAHKTSVNNSVLLQELQKQMQQLQAINSERIADGTIRNVDLAEGAVTSATILDGTISAADLAADSVGSSEIAADAVGSSEIPSGAVGTDELADGAVTNSKLGPDSVTSDKVAADTLTAADLAADSVGSSEIAADSVGSSEIAADSVGSSEIASGAVGTDELADGAVTSAKILDATVQIGDVNQSVWSGSVHQAGTLAARPAAASNEGFLYFATDVSGGTLYRSDGSSWSRVAPGNVVGNSDLGPDSVDSSKILNGTIITEDLADNAVTSAKVALDTLTAADIAADAVTASEIAANAVGSSEIAADAEGSSEIATGAVGAAEVADGSLRAADIGVLNGTVAINPPNITSQSCSLAESAAGSVPGIQVGDQLILSAPSGLQSELAPSAVVQPTADRLTIRLCNVKGGDVDDISRTWGYIITR